MMNKITVKFSWEVLLNFSLTEPGKISDHFSENMIKNVQISTKQALKEKVSAVFLKIIEHKEWQVFHLLFFNRNIIDQISYKFLQKTFKSYCFGMAYNGSPYYRKLQQFSALHPESDKLRMGMALYASGKIRGDLGSNYLVYQAGLQNRKDFLQILLEDPIVDPDHEIGYFFDFHLSLFELACEREDTDLLEMLLKNSKINVEKRSKKMMDQAIRSKKIKVIKTLMHSERVDINANYLCHPPLILAIQEKEPEIAALLLSHPCLQVTGNCLIHACAKNYLDLLELMLEKEIFFEDEFDNPLRYAQSSGALEALKILLKDSRFDPLGTIWGNSAYYYARKNNQKAILELLCKDSRVKKFLEDYGDAADNIYHYWKDNMV